MTKATRAQVQAIAEFAVADICAELAKPNGYFTFGQLGDTILAAFGSELQFNWLTAVRNPMQGFINQGLMVRDTSDLTIERYVRGPNYPKA